MTISVTSTGALASHTDTVTPAYGSGVVAGRLAVLQVASGHLNDSIPAAPSGWTLLDSFSGGGGVWGAGTGPRRLTWFVRILLGSDAAPTTFIPSGFAGSVIAARIVILQRSAGTGWRWATSFGEDTTSGTSFSAPCTAGVTFASADYVVLGYAAPVSTASATVEAVTAAGITFGTITEQSDDSVASGNAERMVIATGAVTAGSATVAPTVTATLAVASIGVAAVLRLREASAAIAATAQAVSPPRVLVSVTGLLAENIVSGSIYRVVGTARTPVRAATNVALVGAAVFLRVDGEQPFGVSTSYAVDLTDVNGATWTVASGSITSTVTADVISDAVAGIGANVHLETPLTKARTRDATKFNVGGRNVVVSRPRSGFSGTVNLRTESDADGDALNELLDAATQGVVLIRKQTTMPGLDGYRAVTDDTEDPTYYDGFRWWSLDVVEVEAWPDALEAAGFTLQDIANNYTYLQDISAANATLLVLAQRSF